MHNVLKGIRTLSPSAIDRLMAALDITIPQVLWYENVLDAAEIRPVPLLRNRVGPGTAASFEAFRGYIAYPSRLITSLIEPVAAYLASDLALPSALHPGDLVLLDQNPILRTSPSPDSCWVVAEPGGLRVRYLRRTKAGLEAGRERDLTGANDWHTISIQARNILDNVRARVVWIGREMETSLSGPYGAAGARH